MRLRFTRPALFVCLASVIWCRLSSGGFADSFRETVAPLLAEQCLDCHGSDSPEAGLDLSGFQGTADVIRGYKVWEIVRQRVAEGEMPPADSGYGFDATQRNAMVQWIDTMLRSEAERNAGDPGPVLARRLNNAEYDNCIQALTGFDLRPTESFPIDPANEAGFDNTGESLSMSPALLRKYLDAARFVSEHLVFTPNSLKFASHPVITDTDRDKYCVRRIIQFYERQPVTYARYFLALRRMELLRRQGRAVATESVAIEDGLSSKYLRRLEEEFANPSTSGPFAEVQRRFHELLSIQGQEEVERAAQELEAWVVAQREQFEPHFENLHVSGVHNGSQTFVLWKNRQYADHRMRAAPDKILAAWNAESESQADRVAESDVPEEFARSVERFCHTFPDTFFVSERGRDYLGVAREKQEKGRLLSAGFHSMMGYFRDDAPLCELILDDEQRAELDQLWEELDFVANAPTRQYQGFLWFERTDSRYMRDPVFDFARPEDQSALCAAKIEKLAEEYLAKAERAGGSGVAMDAIATYFDTINSQIRRVERSWFEATATHVDHLLEIAEKAYRRPLAESEKESIREFYRELKSEQQISHEEAIRDTFVMILMSPYFSYRVDLISDSPDERVLTPYELASRLSFFLWAEGPDEALLEQARSGQLANAEVLQQQVQRMLADPRVRNLAMEFGGNWLDFRQFEHHNSVDRERFPQFDDTLRQAMFEEPVQFIMHLLQEDRSILDCLYAKHTFVNGPLARHYGISEWSQLPSEHWQRVEDASPYHRGGLLPMSVFLTKNAPGLRTSPVKRGYWVVRRLLGEHIPPPPPDVPELPNDESKLGELTLREALAKHREHASCAGCHDRFDSLGIVFESFGPVGEFRTQDLGGRPVETLADFPDGTMRGSVKDLKAYLRTEREAEFVDNFCRKFLAYALGRSLILSDEPLIETMKQRAASNEYSVQVIVDAIVTSRQFLSKRGLGDSKIVRAPGATQND